MIPTIYRAKISKAESHPVGAEIISDALASVPLLEKLTLSFTTHRISDDSRVSPVLRARFTNFRVNIFSSKKFIEEGHYGEKWELTVFAVPRSLKFEIKRLLLEEGFENLVAWLTTERTPLWLEGTREFTISYDEDYEVLRYEDRDN